MKSRIAVDFPTRPQEVTPESIRFMANRLRRAADDLEALLDPDRFDGNPYTITAVHNYDNLTKVFLHRTPTAFSR